MVAEAEAHSSLRTRAGVDLVIDWAKFAQLCRRADGGYHPSLDQNACAAQLAAIGIHRHDDIGITDQSGCHGLALSVRKRRRRVAPRDTSGQ